MKDSLVKAVFMQMKTTVVVLVWAAMVAAQISDGTVALPNKNVDNGNCAMTDLAKEFVNDRALVCAQGQTGFFNGETRAVKAATPPFLTTDADTESAVELTSCSCSQNGVWSRFMEVVQDSVSSFVEWHWEYFGRRNDCTLELKRNLTKFGCAQRVCSTDVICPEGYRMGSNCKCERVSPIVIDLDGNGVELTNQANGTRFDLDGNNETKQVSWLAYGSQDGWLVFNKYEDGVIANGRQLFGDMSPQAEERYAGESRNGYRALRGFDDNKDNAITQADGIWRLLGIWRDSNHNGVSDPGEVTGLTANGITSISLDYKEAGRKDRFGNEFRFRAKVIRDGKERYSYDVFLTAK